MINFYYIKKFKVTKKGKVTAVKAGKAKVTVTEKLKKKKRKIGVVMVKVKAKKAVVPTASAPASEAPMATPDNSEKTVVYNNYFEDGDTNGITGRGSSVEISQSENHTAGGGNPGGCLFLGGEIVVCETKIIN